MLAVGLGGAAIAAADRPAICVVPLRPAAGNRRPDLKFDPMTVPLIDSLDREALTAYARQPEHKALAISGYGLGQAIGATDVESAKAPALQRCALRPGSVCSLYAVDMKVVWPEAILPLPALTEHCLHGINTSRQIAKSVTHVSGTFRHLSLRSETQ